MIGLWRAAWDGEVPASAYRPLQVGVGVMLAVALATALPHAPLHFSTAGLPAAVSGGRWGGWHFPGFDGLGVAGAYGVLATGIVAALLFAAGVAPRAWGLVAFLVHFGLQHRSVYWMDGSDALLRCLLFFLLLAPLGRAGPLPRWPLQLCRLQVAVMYLATAIWKSYGRDWASGDALYWVYSDARYQRFPTDWLVGTHGGQLLLAVGTWATLALEYALPALLLWPRTRRWGLVLGVALHLGILATLRIGLFTPVVLVAYLAFWEDRRR